MCVVCAFTNPLAVGPLLVVVLYGGPVLVGALRCLFMSHLQQDVCITMICNTTYSRPCMQHERDIKLHTTDAPYFLVYCIFKNRAVAAKPRDATVNFDRYGLCRQLFFVDTRGSWHGHAYVLKYASTS